jgi:beta-lactam-binding protein with PASTA domain
VQWQEQDPAGGQRSDTVIGQNPAAGQPVNRGDDVQVTVPTSQNQCQWDPSCMNGDGGYDGGNG